MIAYSKLCPKLDEFCYVCGHIVLKVNRKGLKNLLTNEFKNAYSQYFDEPDTSGKDYTPNTVCKSCYTALLEWSHKKREKLNMAKPVMWFEHPGGHDESKCYACINHDFGLNRSKLKTKTYIATATATLPMSIIENFKPPIPRNPDVFTAWTAANVHAPDPDFVPDLESDEPKPMKQNEMDYIVAKLGLSQRNSEMLTSFLKRRKLTEQNVNATAYRKRQTEFQNFYTVENENMFTYCNDIKGLVTELGMKYIAVDWRLFIAGSVSSLNAVLLHNTNKVASIPVAMVTNMKETYQTLGDILEKIKYNDNKWKICCDIKVVNILQGIITAGGFPKYFCVLCNWDSRYKGNQYTCGIWEARTPENERKLRLCNEPLIKDISSILLPPLHIKLGIAGKFIAMAVKDHAGVFDCLKAIFPKLSNDKIKAGVLNGPDIRKLMNSESFTNLLTGNHRKAWDALKAVIQRVLGKNRAQPDEAKKIVETMITYFEKIHSSMTLKLHFLHSHLDVFLKQLPEESDEQGERFHQTTMPMEKRFKGKRLDALLGDVCWWSHKLSQFESEGEDAAGAESELPLSILSCMNAEI